MKKPIRQRGNEKKKIKSVLVLGSGALQIGQAGEFDYSGSQAIKALKAEGIRTLLVNPNIATVQTSPELADRTYLLPVTPEWIERVIEKERPDGILLGFGGQTALNCGLELDKAGVFKKNRVRVLGTPVEAIRTTEDRELFKKALHKMNVRTPKSKTAKTVSGCLQAAKKIGYPVMVRQGFALGGQGSGKAANEKQLRKLCQKAFSRTNRVLVEEFLGGWKEIEYEVVRDETGNCITVCNMENMDPLGIHTGESIVVAPSQTLSDSEYHFLRSLSIQVISELGIVGECNIQYALHPHSMDYRVIEVNARLSRSSALASKATGYPLATIATQLSLGYNLMELQNAVTKKTSAFFEPSLDYCVVKIPRWDLQKFVGVDPKIGTEMKSVGEVMAIGRNFEEALQKAIRMQQIGMYGVTGNRFAIEKLAENLKNPTDKRLFALVHAMKKGFSVKRIQRLTQIDPWFLHKIQNILFIEKKIRQNRGKLTKELLLLAKRHGFSDKQLSIILKKKSETEIRKIRQKFGIMPFVKQIDTLAAEFPAKTNYLYLTYNGNSHDVQPKPNSSVLVLGSGAYSIGSSVEFDWCTVNAAKAISRHGLDACVINYNPETVSTDFDESKRLYFDELSLETVLDIAQFEKPTGVLVSMGGQVANNLALRLDQHKVHILGTPAKSIDSAENRHKFSQLCDRLGIDQPAWKETRSTADAIRFAKKAGFPVLIRPSYVLSGSAMRVATNDIEMKQFLQKAALVSPEYPVVVTKFIRGAKEIEIDAVSQNGKILCHAISEHVENAGVHSGDATLAYPSQKIYSKTRRGILDIAAKLSKALHISGPFNIQFLAKENRLKVIECNLRASRSFPFVSKTSGHNFIENAIKAMLANKTLPPVQIKPFRHAGVKAPFFSFSRLRGADPVLGVEMVSTGEVGCIGSNFDDAFLKALLSTGYRLPIERLLIHIPDYAACLSLRTELEQAGQNGTVFSTPTDAPLLAHEKIPFRLIRKGDSNSFDWNLHLKKEPMDLVICIPNQEIQAKNSADYRLRRACADSHTPLITNPKLAKRFLQSANRSDSKNLEIKAMQDYTSPKIQKKSN